MNTSDALQRAAVETDRIVGLVGEGDLDRPTPCDEFTVGQLLGHMLGFARLAAHAASRTLPDGPRLALGDGWQDVYSSWASKAVDAWQRPGATEGTTSFGDGELPASRAVAIAAFEFGLHGWDLAVAIGETYSIEADSARVIEEAVRDVAEGGRRSGVFGPEVELTGTTSSFERALALSGRDPAWSPPG